MSSLSLLVAILAYGIVLCGVVPLFPWLETAPRMILAAGLAAGIWQGLRGPWPLRNWMLNTAIVPVFLFYVLQFSRANPVQPFISVLAIMLAVRLAGPKSARHYQQIAALSLFCLAASSLFDLSLSFLLYLVLMLMMVARMSARSAFAEWESFMRGDMLHGREGVGSTGFHTKRASRYRRCRL